MILLQKMKRSCRFSFLVAWGYMGAREREIPISGVVGQRKRKRLTIFAENMGAWGCTEAQRERERGSDPFYSSLISFYLISKIITNTLTRIAKISNFELTKISKKN